jgi:hypothetical protein
VFEKLPQRREGTKIHKKRDILEEYLYPWIAGIGETRCPGDFVAKNGTFQTPSKRTGLLFRRFAASLILRFSLFPKTFLKVKKC